MEQPQIVGTERDLLPTMTEEAFSQLPVKSNVSEMGQRIIDMFMNPETPHPHCPGYEGLLNRLVERNRRRLADPTCTPPHFPISELFADNRSQYVYNMSDPPGTAPVIEIKSKSDVDRSRPNGRRMVFHLPSPDLIEKIRAALQRSKKKKKDKKQQSAEGAPERKSTEPVAVAVDDDLDIFAGIEISSGNLTKSSIEAGPLFAETISGRALPEEDFVAIRNRLEEATRIREQSRSGFDSIAQKRTLEFAEDEFMPDTGAFGEKLHTESFTNEEGEDRKHKTSKSRKKGGGKK